MQKENFMAQITWLGHSAFLIEDTEIKILIDPFLDGCPTASLSSAELPPIDVVLVTHDHADHVGQTVDICKKHKAMLGAMVETACNLIEEGIPQEQVLNTIGFNFGGTVQFKGVSITMVPALHTSTTGLPVGYILRLPNGTTVYHAGDTSIFGDMALWGKLYPIDIACLPIGGVFTMDASQAAHACALLNAKRVIPMHWGTFPALDANTQAFEKELIKHAPQCQCHALQPGQSLEI